MESKDNKVVPLISIKEDNETDEKTVAGYCDVSGCYSERLKYDKNH